MSAVPPDSVLSPGSGVPAGSAVSQDGPAALNSGARWAGGHSELRRRRDALAEQVTKLHWDLGGLAYEMAIRDHFRLDVLVRRAAMLQQRDAELAEIERMLALQESSIAGGCPGCAAPYSRGAVYCWQCGAALMEVAPAGDAAPTGAGVSGRPASPSDSTARMPTVTGSDGPSRDDIGAEDDSTAVMSALLAPSRPE